MTIETLVIRGSENIQEAAQRAADVLLSGGLVVYPTDTSYGIACDPRNETALGRLIAAKSRSPEMGLPLLFSDMTQSERYHDFSDLEKTLARLFWPGALTIVVALKSPMSNMVTGGRTSIAARIPDHPVPRAIAKLIDSPVVGTSANVTGGPSPFDVETARSQLGDKVDLYIDAGPSVSKSNSTIIGVESGTPANIRIYREGELSIEKLTERLRVDSDASRFWSSRLVYSAK